MVLVTLRGALAAAVCMNSLPFAAATLRNNIAVSTNIPLPPGPEPIALVKLPHPPAIPDNAKPGDCTEYINPNGTGCISQTSENFQAGGFLPDGKHILMLVEFVGAPSKPDPASAYSGLQVLAVKTDQTAFDNGDSWKCLSCGVTKPLDDLDLSYPQAFKDGKRALVGSNILECHDGFLVGPDCTFNNTVLHPIRWNTSPDGEGTGGAIRELRLHPDNTHIGYSSFTTDSGTGGSIGQYGYIGKLMFNPDPSKGTPKTARYDVVNSTILIDSNNKAKIKVVRDNQLEIINDPLVVGELRAFSGDGSEVTYIGHSVESSNIDVFAANLHTGAVRRLTSHPEYVDPIEHSPDNRWFAIMDTRTTDRQMWVAGMRHIPPLTDLVTVTAVSSTRNNGVRRFFRPFLLDRWGDRNDYFGQRINDQGSGVAGSGDFNDPEWNGRADPMWSPDSTQIVYWESQTVSPACGGDNPLPCYPATEPDGFRHRIILATFTSRKPTEQAAVVGVPDTIPWGARYVPGSQPPKEEYPPVGNYTLAGSASGHANVSLSSTTENGSLNRVTVSYRNFSNNGFDTLDGTENVTNTKVNGTASVIDWYSNLVQGGPGTVKSTKVTNQDGFHLTIDVMHNIFEANGTLTTTIDGIEYRQPLNYA